MIRPQIKPQREQDADYLAYVKRRPCIVAPKHTSAPGEIVTVVSCGGEVDAHHVRETGKGGLCGKAGSEECDFECPFRD